MDQLIKHIMSAVNDFLDVDCPIGEEYTYLLGELAAIEMNVRFKVLQRCQRL